MEEREAVKARVQELAARVWDVPAIEARYRRLLQDGIAPRRLDRAAVVAVKNALLDRVQRRAEECEYLGHN
ncbi:MAG: hypothetical protein A2Z31_03230 [candidate division NC10 bacterium RBG_16_65_8]|nr:MAG: hypothetical protein A2Z31_03230 [candidate division NC10 bacterium RBG_16_65_8]